MQQRQRIAFYTLTILTILLYLALRLHQLMALPLFIDETLHAERAISVWQGSALYFGSNGKLLSSWWVALFYPFPPWPWLLRGAVLLLTPLSVAAALTLAKRIFGLRAALYTALLLVVAPMLFFFDRMSLADTTLTPLLTVFVLSLVHLLMARRVIRWRAVVCGLALAAAVMAKATALAILPLPLIALWLLPRGWSLLERLKALLWMAGAALLPWIPLLIALRIRHVDFLGVPTSQHSASGSLLDLERIAQNTNFLLDGMIHWFGAAAAADRPDRRADRRRLSSAPGPAAGDGGGRSGPGLRADRRYFALAALLAGADSGGAGAGGGRIVPAERAAARPGADSGGGLLLWAGFFALPFIQTAYTAPESLPLADKDRLEYITSDAAGTRIPDLAAYLTDMARQQGGSLRVTGAISQCYGLSLYLPARQRRRAGLSLISGPSTGARRGWKIICWRSLLTW